MNTFDSDYNGDLVIRRFFKGNGTREKASHQATKVSSQIVARRLSQVRDCMVHESGYLKTRHEKRNEFKGLQVRTVLDRRNP